MKTISILSPLILILLVLTSCSKSSEVTDEKPIKSTPIMNKQEDINKAEGNYVRDGIKFKSKEDLEAYFESQSNQG